MRALGSSTRHSKAGSIAAGFGVSMSSADPSSTIRCAVSAERSSLGHSSLGHSSLGHSRPGRLRFWRGQVRRTGFSLLEVLLVLAIMVAIGAIVAPTMGEAFQRQKVQAAVQSLRADWERARLTAMKTGQAQVFSCVVGTNQYSVQPFMTEADAVNVSEGATVAVSGVTAQVGDGNMLDTTSAPTPIQQKTLDEEVLFVSCVVNSDMRAVTVSQAQGGMTALGAVSELVFFYPDGTTSTAELTIQNLRGDARCVRMRGLTGKAQIHVLPQMARATPTTTGPATAPAAASTQ